MKSWYGPFQGNCVHKHNCPHPPHPLCRNTNPAKGNIFIFTDTVDVFYDFYKKVETIARDRTIAKINKSVGDVHDFCKKS